MINLCRIEIFFGDLISFFKDTSEDGIIRAQTITEINNIKGKQQRDCEGNTWRKPLRRKYMGDDKKEGWLSRKVSKCAYIAIVYTLAKCTINTGFIIKIRAEQCTN